MPIKEGFSWTKKFHCDVFIAIIISALPFGIFSHLLFDQTDKRIIQLLGFSFEHGFPDNSTFIWSILVRLIPALLLILWFFVESHQWRYIILAPVSMNIFSLVNDCFILSNGDIRKEYFILSLSLAVFIALILICDYLFFKNYRNRNICNYRNISNNERVLFKQLKVQLNKIRSFQISGINYGYVIRLLHLKILLGRINGLRIRLDRCDSVKFTRGQKLLIVSLLIATAILPYASLLIPEGKSTISLVWLSIDDNGFYGVRSYIWFNAMKISTLIPLAIWFICSTNWWRYALFSPIILYSYQLWEANQDVQQLDAVGNLRAFPAILAIILVLIILSNVFKYRYGLLEMYDQLEAEIDIFVEQIAKKDLNELHEFRTLSAENLAERSSDQYLAALHRLKQKIQGELANT